MSDSGDYISREAALSAQNKSMNLSECRKRLESIPAADVREVVRAEFVRCGDGKGVPYMCAHCGRTVPANLVEIWGVNFCPNCGADMRGENND